MPILFPLTLIGVGFLVYAVFAGATLALPIGVGVAAGFGSAAIGIAPLPSIFIGIAAFMGTITVGRFAALTLPSRFARGLLILAFAIPAAVTGFSSASTLSLTGFAGLGVALIAGVVTGGVAVHRLARPVV